MIVAYILVSVLLLIGFLIALLPINNGLEKLMVVVILLMAVWGIYILWGLQPPGQNITNEERKIVGVPEIVQPEPLMPFESELVIIGRGGARVHVNVADMCDAYGYNKVCENAE